VRLGYYTLGEGHGECSRWRVNLVSSARVRAPGTILERLEGMDLLNRCRTCIRPVSLDAHTACMDHGRGGGTQGLSEILCN
jgi:hypothetical protein